MAHEQRSAGSDQPRSGQVASALLSGLDREILFFLHQPFSERDEFAAVRAVAQLEEAPHQAQAERRRLIGLQCGELWRHWDAIHADISGLEAVTEPLLDTIVERLQLCIVDARALQLKMLERILSIALLEAHESKAKFDDGGDDSDA